MAQSPFKVDQLQLEPGSGDTLVIDRDPGTGGLRFKDAVVTGGLVLSQLAGLQTIPNVYVVGKSGAGAQYTTIQDALDDVPAQASATNPYLILIAPGVYTETVNIIRDGVHLLGLGRVVIRSALEGTPNAMGADHTLIISAQLGTVPKTVTLENLRITNAHNNKACVRIVGADGSLLGDDLVTIRGCDLVAVASGGNRPLWATAMNNLLVEGGSLGGGETDLVVLEEISWFRAMSLRSASAQSWRWDSEQSLPANESVGYTMSFCTEVARGTGLTPFTLDITGVSASFNACRLPNLVISGECDVTLSHSTVGDLTLSGEVSLTLESSSRGNVNTNASATLSEPRLSGTVTFEDESSKEVSFRVPQPNGEYQVFLSLTDNPNGNPPWVSDKSSTGFTINFADDQTQDVLWSANRTGM